MAANTIMDWRRGDREGNPEGNWSYRCCVSI